MQIDYTGRRYGHLTLLRRVGAGGSGVGAIWETRCDCGASRNLSAKDVRAGRYQTCAGANCQFHRDLLSSKRRTRELRSREERRQYSQAVGRALREGAPWALTPLEFQEIVQRECMICGTSPSGGLMRVEGNVGYTSSAALPFCSSCRQMRGSRTLEDFLGILVRISARLSNRT